MESPPDDASMDGLVGGGWEEHEDEEAVVSEEHEDEEAVVSEEEYSDDFVCLVEDEEAENSSMRRDGGENAGHRRESGDGVCDASEGRACGEVDAGAALQLTGEQLSTALREGQPATSTGEGQPATSIGDGQPATSTGDESNVPPQLDREPTSRYRGGHRDSNVLGPHDHQREAEQLEQRGSPGVQQAPGVPPMGGSGCAPSREEAAAEDMDEEEKALQLIEETIMLSTLTLSQLTLSTLKGHNPADDGLGSQFWRQETAAAPSDFRLPTSTSFEAAASETESTAKRSLVELAGRQQEHVTA
eukprot:gene18017-21454_t